MTKTDTLRGRFEERALDFWNNWRRKNPIEPAWMYGAALLEEAQASAAEKAQRLQPLTEAEIEELAREITDKLDEGWLDHCASTEIVAGIVASVLRGKLGGGR